MRCLCRTSIPHYKIRQSNVQRWWQMSTQSLYNIVNLIGIGWDFLYVIAGAEQPSGQDVKEEIEIYYGSDINQVRLYPDLDTVANKELVEKGKWTIVSTTTILQMTVSINWKNRENGNHSVSTFELLLAGRWFDFMNLKWILVRQVIDLHPNFQHSFLGCEFSHRCYLGPFEWRVLCFDPTVILSNMSSFQPSLAKIGVVRFSTRRLLISWPMSSSSDRRSLLLSDW